MTLDYAVDVLSVEEQLIPEGTGQSLEVVTCYADSSWSQPSFDSVWNDSMRDLGFDEATARLVYQHKIFGSATGEAYTWSTLSGLTLDHLTINCTPFDSAPYILVGYEALSASRQGSVTQVKLRQADDGLYAMVVSHNGSVNTEPVDMFVDENYVPIVRCQSYHAGCEWNDGSRPPDFGVITGID